MIMSIAPLMKPIALFTARSTVARALFMADLKAPPIASPIFVPTFVKIPLIVSQIPEKKDPILLNTFLIFVYASVNFV